MKEFDVDEECPHCDELQPSQQMDAHVATAHADLPPCTARIDLERGTSYTCAFRAGHAKGEHGKWHASRRGGERWTRYVWNDSAFGATPHRPPEPRVVGLDHFKAMGAISHTVVATGDSSPTQDSEPRVGTREACQHCGQEIVYEPYFLDSKQPNPPVWAHSTGAKTCDTRPDGWGGGWPMAEPELFITTGCAVLHTDEQGNTIPCPEEQTDRHPALTAKLYAPDADRLRDAEIRAAVAEHEAEAYRNQVQALVREILRMRGADKEDLPQKVSVIILNEEAP